MEKLKNIKLLLSDVDGVMTDARIWLNPNDQWVRKFNIYDGMGFVRLKRAGIKVGIITASDAHDVRTRFKFLKVDYYADKAKNKIENLDKIVSEAKISLDEIAYIGDDYMDMAVIQKVGFGVCVPHSLEKIKDISDYVTKNEGGHGAVREVCEMILEAQGFGVDL